ncbi:uncharacterized protein LOC130974410 [Arachis stenosperma]|uniref:uncharacterized protein LOC130974410 n=1 Tax=Arachis stenosperma TaxID=217475 RepID=UPI0025AD7BD1|nr:uncharacterized protein LOC130974410 [Arachis stenosperma]
MSCIHAIAAIKKWHDTPHDYVHPWPCMESIRKTYEHFIQPVTSEEYWTRSEFTKPAPLVLKRPIGRPKSVEQSPPAATNPPHVEQNSANHAVANEGNSNANAAPMLEQESGPSVAAVATQSMPPKALFRPPAQSASRLAPRTFRPKQSVRRKPVTKKPSEPVPPTPSEQHLPSPQQPTTSGASPQTLAAAGKATQRLFKFIPTPGLNKPSS